MAHQDRVDQAQAVHPLGDGVIKHGGAAGQALLRNGPAGAQQGLQHHRVAFIGAIAAIAHRVVAVGVGITEAENLTLCDIFIGHGKGSFCQQK